AEAALRASEARFRYQAAHDNLTGLFNTRYLYRNLARLIGTNGDGDSGTAFALIFMDIDHFKAVVDTYGHLNGSRVIQEVAATIQEQLVEPAYAVAYAGDEFVVVLPGLTKEQGYLAAEEIRAGIAARVYLREEGYTVRLTASFGVVGYPEDA